MPKAKAPTPPKSTEDAWKRYSVGADFVLHGESGWKIKEVGTQGLLLERHKPWREIYVPYAHSLLKQ